MAEIIKSIKRTPYQSFATFLILFFTLFLSLVIFNLIGFFYGILSYVEAKPQVIAYFNVNATKDQISTVEKALKNSGKVASINFISQEKALEIYKEFNQDNPLLLEMVSKEILPASLEIYATKPQYLVDIAKYLKNQQVVDDVDYQKDIVDKLLSLTSALRKISLAIFMYLVIISILVVITTTGFKIALKKEEIDIMQLLGASSLYIRKPFLFEGIFFGFLSASGAFLIYYLLYLYLSPILKSYLYSIPPLALFSFNNYGIYVYPPSFNYILLIFIAINASGVLIGFIGNLMATQKYIK